MRWIPNSDSSRKGKRGILKKGSKIGIVNGEAGVGQVKSTGKLGSLDIFIATDYESWG
jgi:hypothetical protein